MAHRRCFFHAALAGSLFAAPVALYSASAQSTTRHVADEVIFSTEKQSGLTYEHIYHSPNVCIYGGFNCAIIIFPPDPVNPRGRTVAHVLVD